MNWFVFLFVIIPLFNLGDIINLDSLDAILGMNFEEWEHQWRHINQPDTRIPPVKNLNEEAKRLLDMDLAEWERQWQPYRPYEAFSRFVADKPPAVQNVFWDQFNYMQAKVDAGRSAYSNAMMSGKSAEEARQAYYDAATTRHIELLEVNKNANIRYGLANAQEQGLFNNNGKYIYREYP